MFSLIFSCLSFALFCEEDSVSHSGGWLTPIWGVPMIAWQIINIILVGIFFYFLLKVKLPSFLKARKADIEKALNKAKEERIFAEKTLAELKEKLSRLDDEVVQIIKEAEKNAEREREILRRNAEESANRLRKEAEEEFKKRQIEAERNIKKFAIDQAVEIAKDLIRKHLAPEDRERVLAEFVKDLKDRING